MDWMTPLGYLIGLGTVGYVLVRGNSVGLIFNAHAILLVYGGTLGATLLSYPEHVILQATKAIRIFIFPGSRPGANAVIRLMMRLVEKRRPDIRLSAASTCGSRMATASGELS